MKPKVHRVDACLRIEISDLLVSTYAAISPRVVDLQNRCNTLTPRQLETLSAVAAGATNKLIAARLKVSLATVKRDLSGLFAYFDVETRAALIAAAATEQVVASGPWLSQSDR